MNSNGFNDDEVESASRYPKHWYDLAGVAWIGMAATAGVFSLYLYIGQDEPTGGILAAIAGILYALLGKTTQLLRDSKCE